MPTRNAAESKEVIQILTWDEVDTLEWTNEDDQMGWWFFQWLSTEIEGIGGADINYEILAIIQDIRSCTQFQEVRERI